MAKRLAIFRALISSSKSAVAPFLSLWLPTFMFPIILLGYSQTCGFWDVCQFSEPFCSSPLCFSRHVSGFFYHFHDALVDLFSVWIYASVYFLHTPCFSTRAPGRFIFSCSVSGSILSLFAALYFTPATTCTRSFWFLCILPFSFIFISMYFLLSPSMLSFRPHARTLCQRWYNVRTSVSTPLAHHPLFSTEARLLNRSASDEWTFSRWNWQWYKSKWLCLFNCSS